MKPLSLSAFFALIFFAGNAQITVPNTTFPLPGDTLVTAVDNSPSGINIGSGGANQVWNFQSLNAAVSNRLVFKNAASGIFVAAYPDATSFTNAGANAETYFKNTTNAFQNLGGGGSDPTGLGLNLASRWDRPYTLRRAPLVYAPAQPATVESSFTVRFSINDLPPVIADTILSRLPIQVDSMGVGIKLKRTDLVDAWGKLTIPGGAYDVLRERREEIRSGKLEVKVPILGWQDVTAFVSAASGLGTFGTDTTLSFHFYNHVEKEPIAVATMSADGATVESVEYKANDRTSAVTDAGSVKTSVFAYPNPAIDEVKFNFNNLPAGDYSLKIFNILGSQVWKDTFYISGTHNFKLDLRNFKKGTYLYNLSDVRGKSIVTKRLMIVRP